MRPVLILSITLAIAGNGWLQARLTMAMPQGMTVRLLHFASVTGIGFLSHDPLLRNRNIDIIVRSQQIYAVHRKSSAGRRQGIAEATARDANDRILIGKFEGYCVRAESSGDKASLQLPWLCD